MFPLARAPFGVLIFALLPATATCHTSGGTVSSGFEDLDATCARPGTRGPE